MRTFRATPDFNPKLPAGEPSTQVYLVDGQTMHHKSITSGEYEQ